MPINLTHPVLPAPLRNAFRFLYWIFFVFLILFSLPVPRAHSLQLTLA